MPISPTEADEGRRVIYRPGGGPAEAGVLTMVDPRGGPLVFVRYAGDNWAKATHTENLEWASIENPPPGSVAALAQEPIQ